MGTCPTCSIDIDDDNEMDDHKVTHDAPAEGGESESEAPADGDEESAE